MPRYLCWPPDEARLQRALAGWVHPGSRASLPLMMEVGGIPCRLQELAGSDPERLKAAYEALSEQSVYLRFMRAKQPATAEQLAFFLDYPKAPQIGLLLTDEQGRPLAMAQSIRRRLHPDRAEFSCIVADHFQHRGAGRRILLALALLAHGEGIREWTAEVLGQNRPMLALLKGLGLPLTLVTGREMVFVRLDLSILGTLVPRHS
ncbi:GCN5-related N-acetyltransferase [Aeromonas hydrophila 4AK4]|nr:GCN5-related N-acetyltransferase [Aeromonas hydrophila 4AK4]